MSLDSGPRIFVQLPPGGATRSKRTYRGPGAAHLRRVVLHTLARAAPQVTGDVGVVVTTDRKIRALNRRFRRTDAATDVLAFPLGDGRTPLAPFGDVVISHETARRQAQSYDATLVREMDRLLIHGTLHLCGYDHHERAQAARMHGLTRRLMREIDAGSARGKRTHA